MWQWWNYLYKNVEVIGKRPLTIRLDGIANPIILASGPGTALVRDGVDVWKSLPSQCCVNSPTRIYLTHVAIMCNKPHTQPILPQVVFASASASSRAQRKALKADLPDNS